SIIDLATGQQPLCNEDGSAVVVFNGEIYNHLELRSRLEERGHRFATKSDTEAIIHSYEEHGVDCVSDLRGMFAFAIWDRLRRRLLLARDRLGIKPLYYHVGCDFVVFASEIKALLTHPRVPREIDPEGLDLYLSLRYVPGPRTMFRGISKLQPGHLLVCDEAGIRLRQYWDVPCPEKRAEPLTRAETLEARDKLAAVLEESVRLRLVADVPLGVFLSGGLDSTSVLAVMNRLAPGEPARSFTVGYETALGDDEPANEFTFARQAADSFGANHQELRLETKDVKDVLREVVWHLDEPVADPACVPLFLVSRLARNDVTVVLSGEGADEILGGYGAYRRMLHLERVHQHVRGARGSLLAAAGQILPGVSGERARHFLRLASKPLPLRYHGVSRGFLPETKGRLVGCDDHARVDQCATDLFSDHFRAVAGAPPLEQMLYVDIKTWLPDDLLVKADKMTMANAQELRVPFLDHRLVELAATLPSELKIRGRHGKAVLRDAMSGVVPQPILERSKKGFPVPTGRLLRDLSGFSREVLLDRSSACRSWFDRKAVEDILDDHATGRAQRDQEIWSLLVFELWHDQFLKRRFEPMHYPATTLQAAAAAG
ncbi:MAG TPA: asparagine synthase (glutamine-hydrolyzing), partial [Thermoanaerobaculia bacterium]|nr:asparagine synthase (glutamine-hydrolyzing) [Thermoanaerobaculia bacterium]